MASQKEVEKWITINGARVPIFKDGSIGGPKALRDKVKATQDKQNKAAKDKAFKEATASRKEKAEKEAKEKAQAAKDKKAGIQKFVVDRDDIGTSTLVNAEVGSKISFERESWTKIGKDKWKNDSTGKTKESKYVYREGIEGESGMEVKITSPKSSQTNAQKNIQKNEDLKEKQIRQNKEQREEAKKQTEKAITELQMYGKKKDGRPYSKKDAEAAVKSMTPQQIKKLADKRDERRAYQEKLTASSDMQLKKQFKTASPEQKKEIIGEMHSRGYFYRDGKWIDRYKARGYKAWGSRDDD